MDRVHALRADDVDYHAALRWQHATAHAVRRGDGAEAIALIQHRPVYTMGARGGRATILAPLDALPAPLVDTDRGGDVTWHGPGQLVAYPILHLRHRDIRPADYVHRLETVLIDTLRAFTVQASSVRGRPGVWVAESKIAAIGVRVQGGVSLHGIALNIDPDLAWYDAIVPCGIADAGVTSMAAQLGSVPSMDRVVAAFRAAFEARFDVSLLDRDPAPLLAPRSHQSPRPREQGPGVRASRQAARR